MDIRILIDCRLKLKNGNRDTVNKHEHVLSAQTLALYRVLIHHFENVILRVVKINVINMKRYLAQIVPLQIKALINKPESSTVSLIKRRGRDEGQLIDDLLCFGFAQAFMGIPLL